MRGEQGRQPSLPRSLAEPQNVGLKVEDLRSHKAGCSSNQTLIEQAPRMSRNGGHRSMSANPCRSGGGASSGCESLSCLVLASEDGENLISCSAVTGTWARA